MARGGSRPGAGAPGYGKLEFLKTKVLQYSELWWNELNKMMKSKKIEEKKFAMTEYNKIQVKMIPQDITSGGEKLTLSFDPVFHVATRETTQDSGESSEI